jgi:hypothetical protein
LQGMLSSHSRISTANEAWILLPYLYSLRAKGLYAEYGHRVAVSGIENLCEFLPVGRADYLSEVRRLAMRIYGLAAKPGSAYFLDKTPRYHFIADDIISLFDDARFVFLWRNPLAVVASMVDTGAAGRWWLDFHKVDLFTGLGALVDVYSRHRDRCVALRYEDLVADPESQLKRIVDYLELQWEPDILQPVSQAPLAKWRQTLAAPVRRRWCRRYLCWIGRERLAVMGYDLDELLAQLSALPARYSVASDLYYCAKAGLWSIIEPAILREKLARIPDWSRIHNHS